MQRKAKFLVLMVCIVIIVGAVGVIGLVGATGASTSKIEWNIVVSTSMEPTIYRGDIVVVDHNTSNVQVGDIIVYNATWIPEEVLHRVIAVDKAKNGTIYFTAKGDNNPVQDPVPVYQNQIVSKVITNNGKPVVIPKIGYISLWIRGL